MRRAMALMTLCVALMTLLAPVAHLQGKEMITARVTVEGKLVEMQVLRDDAHTWLPLRSVAEVLGAAVTWYRETQRVSIEQDDKRSLLTIGSATVQIDDVAADLDAPPILYGNRTYVTFYTLMVVLDMKAVSDRSGGVITLFHTPTKGVAHDPSHPLDPLTADEIHMAASIISAEVPTSAHTQFVQLTLHEPPKAEVLAYRSGQPMRREAFAILFDRERMQVTEVVVDLTGQRMLSTHVVEGVQPPYMQEDDEIAGSLVLAHPDFVAAMKRRSITDLSKIYFDTWAPGYFGIPDEEGHRLFRLVPYIMQSEATTNAYAHPVEGVVAYVDTGRKQVLHIIDAETAPISRENGELGADAIGAVRAAKPLLTTQPAGFNFRAHGQQIRWQNWEFRWSVHPRQGLTLYDVRYRDAEELRSVLYSAALSEMVVPYGDPGPTLFWRNAFDVGEYGFEMGAHRLEPGKQCPNNAAFFDIVGADEMGNSVLHPQLVCLFERDGDLAWTHHEMAGDDVTESRRQQELVLRFMSVVGNYDYGFDWIFHQDGSIEQQTTLTGILEPKGVQSASLQAALGKAETRHGALVAPQIVAPYHQHFFNYRLDFDVDGPQNAVVESEVYALPKGAENPQGNGFAVRQTVLRTEQEAQRDLNPQTHREWMVINPSHQDRLGYPTGYALIPGENAVPYAAPDAWVRRRAGFMNHHLFVTPYRVDELYAAGDYPNQSRDGSGLPIWTARNRGIENEDVVLWYTMGLTHITRPEEWPVMTAHRMGFVLMPVHFFARNPALELPD